MSGPPEPPVPPDCDLTGFGWMPLYGHRLFGSDFNSTCSDAEWRAGVTLWWRAWNQIPAASLPNDDAALARLADLGRDVKTWRKLRNKALRGFALCSDGRLYHLALAQFAVEAWERRIKERARKAKWREKRWPDKDSPEDVPETGTEPGQGQEQNVPEPVPSLLTGKDRTGQDRKEDTINPSGLSIARKPRKPLALDPEMLAWAAEHAPKVNPSAELSKHLDWKKSKGRRFKDDRAAFRNWLRNANERVNGHDNQTEPRFNNPFGQILHEQHVAGRDQRPAEDRDD